jgi:hypothetical protein
MSERGRREGVDKGLNPLQPASLPAHAARPATVTVTSFSTPNGRPYSSKRQRGGSQHRSNGIQKQTGANNTSPTCGPAHQASQWNDDNEQGGSGGHAFLSPHARAAGARVTTHLPSPSHEVKISTVGVGALSISGCMQGQPMCGRQRTCICPHEVSSPGQAR